MIKSVQQLKDEDAKLQRQIEENRAKWEREWPAVKEKQERELYENCINFWLEKQIEKYKKKKYFIFPEGYSGQPNAQYFLEPNSKYGNMLVKYMTDLGYKAEIKVEEHQNCNLEHYGDGEYKVIPASGTYKTYHLEVSWE